MRCNPPLNPLVDMGASQILLIRFFAKDIAAVPIDNEAELFNRYYDAVFTAPLEKELDFIEAVNGLVAKNGANGKKSVRIFDPSQEVPAFKKFLEDELDCLSHYEAADAGLWTDMFEKGVRAGRAIAQHYG